MLIIYIIGFFFTLGCLWFDAFQDESPQALKFIFYLVIALFWPSVWVAIILNFLNKEMRFYNIKS